MNVPYINEGATCDTCIYRQSALKKELDAVRQCKKCMKNNGRPGWDPKPNVRLSYWQRTLRNNKTCTVRRVIS